MFTLRFVSVLATASSLLAMAAADGTTTSVIPISEPTKTLPASAMQTIGCFETGTPLLDYGPAEFQSPGKCQQICLGLNKDVLGLSEGTHCWCGDSFPAKDAQVDNGTCSTGCSGTKEVICGGKGKLWVMSTGNTLNEIDYFDPKDVSSSSSAKPSTITAAPASTHEAESTKVVIATDTPSAAPKPSGPNTAGIAAGVVVGVVGLLAIIGGVWFFLRQKKRRAVEEEYRRQAAVNSFVSGGKLHTSNSSMTDSRLDPDFMARRQSNGSIADNEDYSRRILKVTNA